MAVSLPHNPIDAAAAEWVARRDRGDGGAGQDGDFEQWLAADPRHYGAYVRAAAAWSSLDRGVVLNPHSRVRDAGRFLRDRRFLIAGGVAASAAAAALAVFGDWGRRASTYDTAVGEISRVSLPDGSTATLDTDSQIEVLLTKASRTVRVGRGRVWFEVAKNKDWPFVVEAGPTRVRAVGTAFAVVREQDGAEVVVTEGVVEAWPQASGKQAALRLARGARARVTSDRTILLNALSSADLDRALAWREGNIALEGETLAEASATFNRYNKRKIIVDDPALGARRLVGYFRVQDPQSFAAAAAVSIDAKVEDTPEGFLITKR